MKKYIIIYQFNHSKFGFQNSITIENITPEYAIEQAKKEVLDCYGSKMLKRFTFKNPVSGEWV